MVLGFIIIQQEENMKENGKMINVMEKEQNYGLMVHFMKANLLAKIKKGAVSLNGVINLFMKGILKIIIYMVLANIYGLMEKYMRDTGKIIK